MEGFCIASFPRQRISDSAALAFSYSSTKYIKQLSGTVAGAAFAAIERAITGFSGPANAGRRYGITDRRTAVAGHDNPRTTSSRRCQGRGRAAGLEFVASDRSRDPK